MMVRKCVGKYGKVGGINNLYTRFWWILKNAQKIARVLRGVLQRVLHKVSTF